MIIFFLSSSSSDKRRREDGRFIGSIPILQQLKDKPARRRVGLELSSGPPARRTPCVPLYNKSGYY